jgi:hypothetical protein
MVRPFSCAAPHFVVCLLVCFVALTVRAAASTPISPPTNSPSPEVVEVDVFDGPAGPVEEEAGVDHEAAHELEEAIVDHPLHPTSEGMAAASGPTR